MNRNFTYYNAQHLIFGNGCLQRLATLPMPGKRAMIVTTPDRRYIDRVQALLAENNVESIVYDQNSINPCTSTIREGAVFAAEHAVDFLISVGGGASTDTAKGIAVLMKNGTDHDIWDYVPYYEGHRTPDKGAAPLIVISTTSGTGSEANPSAVISNEETSVKLDVAYSCMYPLYSIVDPELQVSVPKFWTAVTGMDVIFHCAESYLDQFHTPYTDMVNIEGLRYAAKALPAAYREPANLEARANMAIASNLAGIGESMADLISLHAMAHTLGSLHHSIPHGVALSLLAEEAFRHYCTYPVETRSRLAYMAGVVGYGDQPEDFVRFIADMLKTVDLYDIDFRQYGIDPARSREYAEHAVEKIAPYMDKDEQPVTADMAERIFYNSLTKNNRNK